jgi:prepilin-type N-terminal cleavage/methylation domain-containing protein
MSTQLQRGFSAVEVVIAVVVVAAIAGTGYLAYSRMQDSNKTPTASEQTTGGTTPSAPEVNDDSDLDAASKALDETNVDASTTDSSELDTEVSNF